MSSEIEDILDRAEDRENTYDWISATGLYLKVLDFLPELTSRRGEVHERIGFALGKAALQTENVDEFKGRLSKATVNYEKALEVYSKLIDPTDSPRIFLCRAMLAYFGYWRGHLHGLFSEKRIDSEIGY